MTITKMTIEQLMLVFDVIYDSQDHPIFEDDGQEFTGYEEAFGCWIAYEMLNDDSEGEE